MKPNQLQALLERSFLQMDMESMLSDLEDFVEFSERNVEWQKRREQHRAMVECDAQHFDDPKVEAQYRGQMLEMVEYRFDVSLRQRVRYTGLTALITTIEWGLLALRSRASFPFPRTPRGESEVVHVLQTFDERGALGLRDKVEQVKFLVQVRNCVVHAAGLVSSYRYEAQLRNKLVSNSGIAISAINLLGEAIEIEDGFLHSVLADLKQWLPNLENKLLERQLVRE